MGAKLLIHPAAVPGEHRLGHLLRLAELNGLRTVNWLPHDALYADCPDVAFRTWRYARHCPVCLRESGMWRDDWTLSFLPFCERHRVWLSDTCGRCRRRLAWNGMRLFHCRCGADLRDAPAAKVAMSVKQMIAVRSECGRASAHGPPQLAQLWPAQVARLIMAIGGTFAFPRTKRAKRKLSRSNLNECVKVTIAASQHLVPWPEAMREDLRRLLRQRERRRLASMSAVFAQLYRPLYKELTDPAFDFLRHELGKFAAEHWPEPVNRRHKLASSFDVTPRLPLAAAARQLGVRATTLVRLCGAAGIAIQSRSPRQGTRRARSLTTVDVERLREWRTTLVTVRTAASLLEVGRSRVRELIRAGELPGVCVRASEVRIERAAVLAWQARLVNVAQPARRRKRLIELRFALQYLIPKGGFAPLVDLIAKRRLSTYVASERPNGLGSLLLDKSEVATHLGKAAEGPWLTVPMAAKLLGLKQQVAYALVRRGHLPHSKRRHGVRRCVMVCRESLTNFSDNFVSAGQLAAASRTSARSIVCRLRQLGVEPVSGPTVDGCRQVFYERQEVVRSGAALLKALR